MNEQNQKDENPEFMRLMPAAVAKPKKFLEEFRAKTDAGQTLTAVEEKLLVVAEFALRSGQYLEQLNDRIFRSMEKTIISIENSQRERKAGELSDEKWDFLDGLKNRLGQFMKDRGRARRRRGNKREPRQDARNKERERRREEEGEKT